MKEAIICYDICCPKRLVRLHRFLKKQAVPIQYSVFLFTGNRRQLKASMNEAVKFINPKEDDLRAYPLPSRGLKARLGKRILPEGILLGSLPDSW